MIEAAQLALERVLGRILRPRLEARVDREPGLGQVLLAVVAPQGAPHEVEVRGIVGTRGTCGDPERPPLGLGGLGGGDDLLVGELLQHEIAPREHPVGVPARIFLFVVAAVLALFAALTAFGVVAVG